MKQLNTKLSLLCVSLFMVFFAASCDQKADPAGSVSADSYPTATVTSDLDGNTVTEGDTVHYNITLDKPSEHDFPFNLEITGGSASSDDYSVTSATYPAYEEGDTVTVEVVFTEDNLPEEDETLSYNLVVNSVGVRKLISPNSELPSGDLTIKNHNNPNGLTVVFDWNNPDDDLDLFSVLYQGGSPVSLNQDGATGNKPEKIVDDSGVPGTYYYAVNPYDYNQSTIDYTISIGYPDQSIDSFNGSFNADAVAAGKGVLQPEPALGAAYGRVLKVTSTSNGSGANSFEVKNLNPGSSGN